MKTYTIGEEDTFLDIARNFDLGYVELRAANPEIDPWSPLPGEKLVIPGFKLLPRAPQNGIVVNIGEMRMYFFRGAGLPPLSFPLGIGREGLETPTGATTVTGKLAGLTTRTSAGTGDYILYSFQLIDARTSEIVWEDAAEIKKQGLEDAAYR